MKIKILLAEDHKIVREGIRFLIESEPDIEVVGEASNGHEALKVVKTVEVTLVIMDLTMPEMNGLECTKKLKAEYPHIKVLILSMHDHENYLIDLLDAGADGYVLKSATRDELLFAVRRISSNGIYVGPEFTLSLLAKFRATPSTREHHEKREQLNISDREMEVLNLVAEGKTNSEIARTLFTSVRTIETRRKNLLDKTQTNNTATLIRYAVQHGLVK